LSAAKSGFWSLIVHAFLMDYYIVGLTAGATKG